MPHLPHSLHHWMSGVGVVLLASVVPFLTACKPPMDPEPGPEQPKELPQPRTRDLGGTSVPLGD
jgi:hypothetical protein